MKTAVKKKGLILLIISLLILISLLTAVDYYQSINRNDFAYDHRNTFRIPDESNIYGMFAIPQSDLIIAESPQGEFMNTSFNWQGGIDILFISLDDKLEVKWSNIIGTPYNDSVVDIKIKSDFISLLYKNDNNVFYLSQIGFDGTELYTINKSISNYTITGHEVDDNKIFISGYDHTEDDIGSTITVYDLDFTELTNLEFNGSDYDLIKDLTIVSDELFSLIETNSTDLEINGALPIVKTDGVMVKLSQELEILDKTLINGSENETDLKMNSLGENLIISGSTTSNDYFHQLDYSTYEFMENRYITSINGSNDLFVTCLSSDLEMVWSNKIVQPGTQELLSAVTIAEGVLLSGTTTSEEFNLVNSYFDNFAFTNNFVVYLSQTGLTSYSSSFPFDFSSKNAYASYNSGISLKFSITINTELLFSTSPDPLSDIDKDLIVNGFEIQAGANPSNGMDFHLDFDGDEMEIIDEYIYHTRPDKVDTDKDGIMDGIEFDSSMNPLINDLQSDSDNDGLSNIYELNNGLNPGDKDSDSDGDSDDFEIQHNYDPTNPISNSRILPIILIMTISITIVLFGKIGYRRIINLG